MNEPVAAAPAPMPFRMILDEAVRLGRRNFRTLFPSVALPIALAGMLMTLSQVAMTLSGQFLLGVLFIPVFLLYLAVVIVASLALQFGAMDAAAGRLVRMGDRWLLAVRPRVLGTAFLWWLANLASLLCCFFPALYVVPLLSLVPAAMLEEGRFFGDALSRSAELTRWNPRGGFFDTPLVKVLAFLFVGYLLSAVVGLLVSLPFQFPIYLATFRAAASGEEPPLDALMWLQVPGTFVSGLASSAVMVYVACGIALLFFDFRGRREGSDLEARIGDVFGEPVPPPLPPPAPPAGGPV
jgi:hypothetical protein